MSMTFIAIAAALLVPAAATAQRAAVVDTVPTIAFGGFIDTYYAFDFNRPANYDRAFTTQPARHNEFNVNLAYLEATVRGSRTRGRLAIQMGNSVQANYAGEPRHGSVSGSEVARLIQEAVVGMPLSDDVWLDGGIFLSHIGMESFISQDNPMYTRSLVADFSPYYESGVKLTWRVSKTLSALVTVVNGWQTISETNAAKSAGVRIDYARSERTTLTYYNYLGDEAPDSAMHSALRFFNGIGIRTQVSARLGFLGQIDAGIQQRADGLGRSAWYGGMVTGRYEAAPMVAVVGRVERYADPEQVIIATGLPDGVRLNGASIGLDTALRSRVRWRTELRGFVGETAVFPKNARGHSTNDVFIVTSLALSL